MWKAGLAAVVALVIGSTAVSADSKDANLERNQMAAAAASGPVLSLAHVARLKSALKLTAEQEPLWTPIEHAFREICQAQGTTSSQGLVQGLKNRATSIGLNALALRRLASAAYPLIRTLDAEQKQSAMAFARSVGLHSVAAAF